MYLLVHFYFPWLFRSNNDNDMECTEIQLGVKKAQFLNIKKILKQWINKHEHKALQGLYKRHGWFPRASNWYLFLGYSYKVMRNQFGKFSRNVIKAIYTFCVCCLTFFHHKTKHGLRVII